MKLSYYILQFLDWTGVYASVFMKQDRVSSQMTSSQMDSELLAVLSDLSVTSHVGCQGKKANKNSR